MKRWMLIAVVIVVVGVIIYLDRSGLVDWPIFTMIAAPFVALYKGLSSWFSRRGEAEASIHERFDKIRQEDTKYHDSVMKEIARLDGTIETLRRRANEINLDLTDVKDRLAAREREFANMTPERLRPILEERYGSATKPRKDT